MPVTVMRSARRTQSTETSPTHTFLSLAPKKGACSLFTHPEADNLEEKEESFAKPNRPSCTGESVLGDGAKPHQTPRGRRRGPGPGSDKGLRPALRVRGKVQARLGQPPEAISPSPFPSPTPGLSYSLQPEGHVTETDRRPQKRQQ